MQKSEQTWSLKYHSVPSLDRGWSRLCVGNGRHHIDKDSLLTDQDAFFHSNAITQGAKKNFVCCEFLRSEVILPEQVNVQWEQESISWLTVVFVIYVTGFSWTILYTQKKHTPLASCLYKPRPVQSSPYDALGKIIILVRHDSSRSWDRAESLLMCGLFFFFF